jgi:putative serine protease PepD
MGGYVGRSWILLMVRDGQILSIDVGTPDGIDPAGASCPTLVKNGQLHPVSAPILAGWVGPVGGIVDAGGTAPAGLIEAVAGQSAASAAAKGGIGISFVPSPFGAAIMAVAPGSPADKAGLKAGESIESVNGIAIKGFTLPEMTKLLRSASGDVIFGVIGVGVVRITRPPA